MEQRIAPTSPKAAFKKNQNNKESSRGARWSLVMALILGSVGGAIATVLLVLNSDRWVSDLTPLQGSVIIRPNTKDYSSREQAQKVFIQKIAPTILTLYKKVGQKSGLEESLINQNDRIGFGELVTSDGYFITLIDAVQSSELIVAIDGKGASHDVAVVVKDEVSKIALGKISGNGYTVADISDNQNQVPLEPVTVVHTSVGANQPILRQIILSQRFADLRDSDVSFSSSENFFSVVTFNEQQSCTPGTPLYRGDETLLGLCSGETIVYLPETQQILNQMLNTKKITYPFLGIKGIDLAYQQTLPEQYANSKRSGFLVASSKKQPAVSSGSPAAKSGILSGDIIVQVGSTVLDATHTLGQALLSYKPGETVSVRLFRKNVEEKINVVLTQQ